ncbi:MAG: cytidine deaminase [Deltaproteobacteria bacterium]|jgi:cytidine deaminase
MSGANVARIDWPLLEASAREAREQAYAPYSAYRVGAALLAEDGRVFTGANVENASYGLCQCAERSAIGAAVTAGARRFSAIAIVTGGAVPATPCGMCRQVLAEFPPSFPVRCVSSEGGVVETDTAALLPSGFGPGVLAGGRG